jgi:hypothetical protein
VTVARRALAGGVGLSPRLAGRARALAAARGEAAVVWVLEEVSCAGRERRTSWLGRAQLSGEVWMRRGSGFGSGRPRGACCRYWWTDSAWSAVMVGSVLSSHSVSSSLDELNRAWKVGLQKGVAVSEGWQSCVGGEAGCEGDKKVSSSRSMSSC